MVRAGRSRPGACVSAPRPLVLAFLDRTDAIVAVGEERSEQAIDALLRRLLDG